MFAAVIYLRYSLKDIPRPFRIGKNGNKTLWIVSGAGFFASFFALVISFMPPKQIETGSNVVWYAIMITGCLIFMAAPFIILAFKKPEWKSTNSADEFKPFHWEEKV